MPLNIPILLTWLRIVMIPMLVAMYYLPEDVLSPMLRDQVAAIGFVLAGLTDWFDGWLARRWNQTSAFGAFLDPVADKLMVCTALLVLLDMQRVDTVIALIIIGRQSTISALREGRATLGARASVAVHRLGKFKTAAQMAAIPLLLLDQRTLGGYFDAHFWGARLAEVAAVLTVWSMMYYLKQAWPIIKERG